MSMQAFDRTNNPDLIPGAQVFDAALCDRQERLEGFEKFVYGDRIGYQGQARIVGLSDTNENYIRCERQLVGSILASNLQTSGYTTRASDDPKSEAREYLILTVVSKGCGTLRREQCSEQIYQGDAYINLSNKHELTFSEGTYNRIIFPKRLIAGLDQIQDEFLILRDSDPITDVVRSAAESVSSALKSRDEAQAKLMADLMLSISQKVLEAVVTTPAASGYDHIRDRAMEYMRDNLHRSDLSVAEVAEYLNISRATLYRAFETVGGLKEFITSERLAVAKSMLRRGRTDRGYVTSIAYSIGFATPEHFSKVFKARTGQSPSQFARRGLH